MHQLGGPEPISLEGIRHVNCVRVPQGYDDSWIGILYRGDDLERRVESHAGKKFTKQIFNSYHNTGRTLR